MRESFYLNKNTALINFSQRYYSTTNEIVSSDSFKGVILSYIQKVPTDYPNLHAYVTRGKSNEAAAEELVHLLKLLLVLELEEIDSPYLEQPEKLLEVVEDVYNYWRSFQRCTIIKQSSSQGNLITNFIDADTKFNSLILSVYRSAQEKIQGSRNHVYRQLNAGSNASMVVRDIKWSILPGYEVAKGIPFIDSILLRTPLLLHPKSTTRSGSFKLVSPLSVAQLPVNKDEYFCYPAKVGQLLIFINFHRDFTFSGISLANLFELADNREVQKRRPDCVLFFGVKTGETECTYFYDESNRVYTGVVPYQPRIDYFGYMKKMVLTLHNAAMMRKGWLPLHGSMVNLHFKDGTVKGLIFIGDSGAGKSETIEAIEMLKHPQLAKIDVIFDDMGTLHLENGKVVAQGTEIGAFVRLDDLDAGSPYKNMERSIFMNPETANARVIIPVSTYAQITKNHPVDYFLYANNYDNKEGMHLADRALDMKDTFIMGKRMALGTTDESGVSTTYFANPFGPMQEQELCDHLIDQYFEALDHDGVLTGEVYTGLGVKEMGMDHLYKTAKAILSDVYKK